MGVSITALVACASSGEEQAAAQQAVQRETYRLQQLAVAAEEQARLAVEREQQKQAALARLEEARLTRVAAEREEEARARAAQEQRRQEQARHDAQFARIAELEAQIETARASTMGVTEVNVHLEQIIVTAEALLAALNAEQLKYGNTDASGQLVEPLRKDLIAELESRKDRLEQEAEAVNGQ